MNNKKILFSLLCTFLVLFLSSCAPHTNKKMDIAVIVKATNSEFWQSVKKGAESAATEYNVSISFEGPGSEEDYETQNDMIRAAVKRGADAIVFSAIDYKKSSEALTYAAREGLKIIAIDSAADSSQIGMFIGTDNEEAGELAGKAATDLFAPESRIYIGLVNCYERTDNGIKREKGLKEYIDSVSNAEIIASTNVSSNTNSAIAGAIALLKNNPKINVLIGLNEWTTLGVGYAIRELNLSKKVIGIGFDSNKISIGMLETGEMNALIIQNPFSIGFLGVKNAAKLITGEAVEKDNIYTTVTTVTKDNLFDKNIQKLIFSFN